MSENSIGQFDQAFETMLESGNRHDCANYRNCILEEINCRGQDDYIKKISHKFEDEISELWRKRVKMLFLFMLITLAFILNAIMILFCVKANNTGLAIFNIFIAFINLFNMFSFYEKVRLADTVYRNSLGIVIYIPKVPASSAKKYPDIFRVIDQDTDEILQQKKKALDKVLGF